MTDLLALTGAVLAALTLPGTVYLAVLTLAATLPARRMGPGRLAGRLVVVVPAHDEAAGIAATLHNLLPLAARDGDAEVLVVADNCRDATATIARHCGARVLVRDDPARRGKGHALDVAFRHLLADIERPVAAVVVIDADSVASSNLLPVLRGHLADAGAVQLRYLATPADGGARARLGELALAAFNVLRPRGRDRLGLSAGILGNGFALRRDTLLQVPYRATSVVEDLEYHLLLIDAGVRVRFTADAGVQAPLPAAEAGRQSQRARWEGGRLRVARDRLGPLAASILRGQWRQLEPLADLLLLPLGHHVVALTAALALAPAGARAIAAAGLATVLLHVVATPPVAALPWRHLRAFAAVPAYLVWKLARLGATLAASRRHTAWVRTDRSHP